VVGLRPTFDRVSNANALGLTVDFDTIGPLARSVSDIALAFAAIAGYDFDRSREYRYSSREFPTHSARLLPRGKYRPPTENPPCQDRLEYHMHLESLGGTTAERDRSLDFSTLSEFQEVQIEKL
jgi:hypothetical protein